jgi:drug/metabolite transporter (DMT)-like permease
MVNAGLALTDATRAAFLAQFSVTITPVIALLARQEVPALVLAASGVALLGVLLLGADGAPALSLFRAMHKGFGLGDVLCLVGAACESMHLFRLRSFARQRFPAVQLQTAKTAFGAALFGAWLAGDVATGSADVAALWPGWARPLPWGILLFNAVVPGALADVWCVKAIGRVSATTADVILSMECVFAAAIAFLLLGERLGPRGFCGAAFLIAAAILAVAAESGKPMFRKVSSRVARARRSAWTLGSRVLGMSFRLWYGLHKNISRFFRIA